MAIPLPPLAALLLIGSLVAPVAAAQERAVTSNINRLERTVGPLPQAVRGNLFEPQWVIEPRLRWPAEATDVSGPVTVTSECSVSKGGSMRGCRIIAESLPNRGFGQAFLRALAGARVGTSAPQIEGITFRTTATFDPPSGG